MAYRPRERRLRARMAQKIVAAWRGWMGTMDTKPANQVDWVPIAGFDENKCVQMAGYLTQKAGQPTSKLKLIKLIYLAEREFLSRYLLPMTLDEFYSMKDGPVASAALNGLNGKLDKALWGAWIQNKANRISAVKKRSRDDFDYLSDADIEVLDAVWETFGRYTTWQIWTYVHTNLPEYQEVQNGRLPISYSDLLTVLKKQNVKSLEENIRALQREAAFM